MKAEQIFWTVLVALIVSALIASDRKSETLTAYYDDGERTLYHADVSTQSVATFSLSPTGDPLFYASGLMHSCHVGDYRNCACPSVVTTNGEIDANYGFLQAIDGIIGVTKPKRQLVPIPWYRWKLRNVGRFFEAKPKDAKE
jgi:hypothetical protein